MLSPFALLGAYQEVQQQFAPQLPSIVPASPLVWFMITLTLLCILVLEGAYRRIRTIRMDEILPLSQKIIDLENQLPTVEVTPMEEDNNYFLEVKNNGNAGEFEAQIKIVEDATGNTVGDLYFGYWDYGRGNTATIRNIDRVRIAHREITVYSPGHTIVSSLTSLQLFCCDNLLMSPQVRCAGTWSSDIQDALKPSYILQVTISSTPPLKGGKFMKEYRLDLEGLKEITQP